MLLYSKSGDYLFIEIDLECQKVPYFDLLLQKVRYSLLIYKVQG